MTWKSLALFAVGGVLAGILARWTIPEEGGGTDMDGAEAAPDRRHGRMSGAGGGVLEDGPLTRFARRAAGADAARCERLVDELLDAGRPRPVAGMEVVLRRWMALESPEEVAARFRGKLGEEEYYHWNEAMFRAWLAHDYEGAMAGTKTVYPDEVHGLEDERALAAIRYRDPDFADYLKEARLRHDDEATLALESLGRDRPEMFAEIFDSDLAVAKKAEFAGLMARGRAGRDPAAAFDWARSLTVDEAVRSRVLGEVLAEWRALDPQAAAGALAASGMTEEAFSASGSSAHVIRGLFGLPDRASTRTRFALGGDPLLGVEEWHQSLSAADVDWDGPGGMLARMEHDGWYPPDPQAAAGEAAGLPAGEAKEFILRRICRVWAERDDEAARDFAARHGVDMSGVERKPDPELRRAAFESPGEVFAPLLDPEASPDEDRARVLKDLAKEWARVEPRAAAEHFLPLLERGGDETYFFNILGYSWAKHDPHDAIRWLEELPEGAAKTNAWRSMNGYVREFHPELDFRMDARLWRGDHRMDVLAADLRRIRDEIGEPVARVNLAAADLSEAERETLRAMIHDETSDPR